MKQEQYIIKKFVRATSAKEALKLDRSTPVTEVFLASDKPSENLPSCIGFKVWPEYRDGEVPYESRKK